ncbi:MFS transporter [Paenibacillus eucommiae]|uniref:ACDE family multidrug resistance protein n=1 Tax=Paenibacillus eucommiae TaxID=1355755 RepID=A0ABS4IU46_9BACL|nr:MFS transporter [Paenibacillus eucommiae]MBP1991095.1 ACDE family multidrug resistance protein [Paenibacillus eucommiae]
MESSKKWDLLVLSSIPLVMTLGNSMLIPILPQIRNELHISNLQVSLLITVYSVMAILLIPIAGYLSDRYGRKVIIIPSLIITGIGGAICGFAAIGMENSYGLILTGRLIQGIGAAGAMPIVLPLVADMLKSDDQISYGLGLIETSNTFGKVLSPIAGSALALIAWYAPFLAIPVISLVSLLLVILRIKAPQNGKSPIRLGKFLKDTLQLYKQKALWLTAVFISGGITMFVLFGLLFYLSEKLEDTLQIKGIVKGFILAIPLAILCLASFITGKMIGKHKKLMKWLLVSSFCIAVVAIGGSIFFDKMYVQISCLSTAGLGIGMALPCLDAFITEGIDKEQRGTISSLYSSMRFVGVALGPPLASVIMARSEHLLFILMTICSAAGGLLALLAIKPGEATSLNKKDA